MPGGEEGLIARYPGARTANRNVDYCAKPSSGFNSPMDSAPPDIRCLLEDHDHKREIPMSANDYYEIQQVMAR